MRGRGGAVRRWLLFAPLLQLSPHQGGSRVFNLFEHRECGFGVGDGFGAVAEHVMRDADVEAHDALVAPVADLLRDSQRLFEIIERALVFAQPIISNAQTVQGVALAEPVADFFENLQSLVV